MSTRAAVRLVLALAVSACATPRRYMGLDLATADAPLRATALAARGGDKAAQFRLARWLETGAGIAPDRDRACQLYRLAAASSGGTMYIYSPPVRRGGAGRVIPVSIPVNPGLPEAAERAAEICAARP